MKFGRVFLPGGPEMMVENARLAEHAGSTCSVSATHRWSRRRCT
jgi:hypothetical protein